jgi:quinol monooxygenase YgiN
MTKSKRRSEIAPYFAPFFLGFVMPLGGGACAHDAPPAQSAESAPASAEPGGSTAGDVQPEGGASVFVVHHVGDFDAFRKFFEEGEEERTKAGVLGYLLSRLDDGRVVIHFFAKDVKQVAAALNSSRMQEYLSRKGAPDASLVWVTVDERVTIPPSPPAGQTWSLFFKLRTPDVAAFEKAFDGIAKVYAEQGVVGFGLHRSTSQEDIVILHFMGTDREKLAALSARPEFVELLGLAGGAAAAKPLLGEDLARKRPK